MITIDGDAKVMPLDKLWFDTLYYVGKVETMVPKSLISDIVIDNIPGVLDKPGSEWKHLPDRSIAVVMPRAQSKKAAEPTKAFKAPNPYCETEVNIGKLKTSKKDNCSLKKI